MVARHKIVEARKKGVTVDAILHERFEIMKTTAQINYSNGI